MFNKRTDPQKNYTDLKKKFDKTPNSAHGPMNGFRKSQTFTILIIRESLLKKN